MRRPSFMTSTINTCCLGVKLPIQFAAPIRRQCEPYPLCILMCDTMQCRYAATRMRYRTMYQQLCPFPSTLNPSESRISSRVELPWGTHGIIARNSPWRVSANLKHIYTLSSSAQQYVQFFFFQYFSTLFPFFSCTQLNNS